MIRPFDYSSVVRTPEDIARYTTLHSSLVEMLRDTVERAPKNEAVVELAGRRLNYRDFWALSSRVAGGLRKNGINRGDRVAIRLGNSVDWCLAFFGIQMAGAIAV